MVVFWVGECNYFILIAWKSGAIMNSKRAKKRILKLSFQERPLDLLFGRDSTALRPGLDGCRKVKMSRNMQKIQRSIRFCKFIRNHDRNN